MNRRTVTITQARELAGVSRRTIYNWMQQQKVEYVRTAGGGVRIFLDTLFLTPTADTAADTAAPAKLPPFPYGPLIPPAARERLRLAKATLQAS
jgi:excisionase family DNA binding protein